jgi:glycosyltransferase involved in cell wall biosynthesis
MKILQLSLSLGNGGAEKFVVELCNELSKENEVILCTYRSNEVWMIPPTKIVTNVRNITLNISSKRSPSNWIKAFWLIRKEQPDVVHVHTSLVAFYMMMFPILFPDIKFVHTIHSSYTPAYSKLFTFFSFFSFAGRKWINVCISKSILSVFQNNHSNLIFKQIDNGISELQITNNLGNIREWIFNLINNDPIKIFIAIGNYSDVKRFDLLVEVMNYFYNKNENIHLLLIGEDKSTKKLNLSKINKIKNENVHILGSKENIYDYLMISDALILSSSEEGMPLVILEAMSLGKPIISTPAGGVVDLVKNGYNGFISKDLSKEALIESVQEFLRSPKEILDQISSNNLQSFKNKYSIIRCAFEYLSIYKN